MKRYLRSSAKPITDAEIQKNFDFNDRQMQVGSKLKTYKGSPIQRCPRFSVGKEIGGDLYVHKDYADEVVPETILKSTQRALESKYPDFEYNCIKYDPNTFRISFQEVPNFDTEREPVVGDYVIVEYHPSGSEVLKSGHTNHVFHHKWLWCKNDYTGFDVAEAWNWSKKWLSTLREPSDGNGIARWNAQLDKYNLTHDN